MPTDQPSFSDIGHLMPYPELYNAGLESYRRGNLAAIMANDDARTKFPTRFPFELWQEQTSRYMEYWKWYTGAALLDDVIIDEKSGDRLEKYPLRVNPFPSIVQKKASLVFGEPPSTAPFLARSNIRAKPFFNDDEKRKEIAKFYESFSREVWEQSNGPVLIAENAILAQILGGQYIQVEYRPQRTDALIPIFVKNVIPDFVLPIWENDRWELSECWITYRMSGVAAQKEFGGDLTDATWVFYVEHWTRDTYSIWIDGKPLVANYPLPNGESISISYDNAKNPFGFVPITYIPRMRSGSFWGPSVIPPLTGLAMEFNQRFADMGEIVSQTAHRRWFGRNLSRPIEMKNFDDDQWYGDLGVQNPSLNSAPEIWSEQPPVVSNFIEGNLNLIWDQILRGADLTKVHYGEDEGSQRSGETLEIRSWPALTIAKQERLYLNAGFTRVDAQILRMAAILGIEIDGKKVDMATLNEYSITHQWHPMVERSRESLIAEIVQLRSLGDMSLRRSIESQGTVMDIEDEILAIEEEAKQAAEVAMQTMQASALPGKDGKEDARKIEEKTPTKKSDNEEKKTSPEKIDNRIKK